jgi:hypothetical protein
VLVQEQQHIRLADHMVDAAQVTHMHKQQQG